MRFARMVPLCVALLIAPAAAEFPYPTNPSPCPDSITSEGCVQPTEFHRYLFLPETDPPTLPNDFNANWKLTSATTGDPSLDSSAQELYGVTGASVDLAWQVTTGRPDVLIAVLDSGIRWGEQQPDILNKYYLNRAELPVPEGSTNTVDPHDRNGDGVFNVKDYAGDSRVSDQNGTGVIDPEDLIFIFSDGVDDDDNGYTDDISGWDFWEDDNDPLDEVRYGHGTGESHDSAAEANNGRGDAGTCPNCMLLEVRVGDSFVAEVNDFAQAVIFGVDSGARVIQEALGSVNNSHLAQQAVDYAFNNGVVVIASAADESSNHNNFPAVYNHTVEVNSVVKFFDQSNFTQTPKSYLYFNGCTNFGGHIHVAVPSESCSSEATGLSSGMAGLVVAAALNEVDRGNLSPYPATGDEQPASFALSPEEIKQVLTMTVDDINFDARDDVDPPLPQNYSTNVPVPGIEQSHSRYPSIAGWDQYFGYGRINASAAVRRVQQGRIPPEATLETPTWFSYLRLSQETIGITGRVAARRAGSFSYSVEVAAGIQPAEDAFVEVYRSEQLTDDFVGTLATIDLDGVASMLPHGASGAPVVDDGSNRGDVERFTFTVRLRVADDTGQLGEDRRTLFLHDDPTLVEGFPMQLQSDGASPPLPADVDGDGIDELLLATSDGIIHAFHLDGSEAAGWPVTTDPIEAHSGSTAFRSGVISVPSAPIIGELAAGDLDHDGGLEIAGADVEGKVYVWNSDGTRRLGFPVSTLPQYSSSRRSERDPNTPEGLVPDRTNRHTRDNRLGRGIAAGVVLVNLDPDAGTSLEILTGSLDRHLYAWTNNGTPIPGWPVMLRDPQKVESVDPVTNEVTYLPTANQLMGTKIIRSPSVGDLDGDGRPEIVAVVNEGYNERLNASPDGILINFLIVGGLLEPGNTRVYAVHADGTMHGDNPIERGWNPEAFVDGWPVKTGILQKELLPVIGTGSNGPPALADFDGDGLPEVTTFSAVGPLYIFNGEGRSFLGTSSRNIPIVLAQEPFGPGSNSVDHPTFGSLGGPAVAELRGPGTGWHVVAPTTGLGKLIDTALPSMQTPADNHLTAWSVSRNIEENFPRQTNDLQFFAVPVVADITGDGLPEILMGSGVRDLHGVDINGDEATGWPKFTAGWTVSPPAVADFDGDGNIEVAHVTREGFLFVWRTAGEACGYQPWPHGRHDAHGTSNAATDAKAPGTAQSATFIEAQAGSVRFRLDVMPGDDLFCGQGLYEARFSEQPIVTDADFFAASRAASVIHDPSGRHPGEISISDPALVNRTLYFALMALDESANRSRVMVLGSATLPQAPTPTTTATASFTLTPTSTPVNTSTPQPTQTTQPTTTPTIMPAATSTPTQHTDPTPTASRPPTPTPTRQKSGDDGCAINPRSGRSNGLTWLLCGAAIVVVRRRHAGRFAIRS